MTQNELYHYGVLGMKWGVRRTPDQLGYHKSDSSVTKRVKKDYNSMNDQEFLNKYKTSKRQYAKRVEKYGDPYMNGPMAKMGKKLAAKEKAKTAQVNAKNKRKQAINSTYKNLNKNTSFGEKLVYNNATRKRAAKYVVDNNMTVSEATKKAKGDAWKNTAAFLSIYGIGTAVALKKMR